MDKKVKKINKILDNLCICYEKISDFLVFSSFFNIILLLVLAKVDVLFYQSYIFNSKSFLYIFLKFQNLI